ncbi:MAG: hypothetical protein IKU56_04555 [Clostridia bacterium]|nr:hypothetical protein [Clostridia bacterium]
MSTYLTIRPRLNTALVGAGIVCSGIFVLLRPEAVAGGISRGLSICASVIIPSLFPFLVLGGFLSKSGVAAAIGSRLEHVTRLLFGLPGCCAAGILISFVGGYPAGGTVVGELTRSGQITRDEGQRMLRFCVCGGPGFVISTVGAGLMGSAGLGVILFAAHIAAALLLGILGVPPDSRRQTPARSAHRPRVSVASAFVESVTAACHSLLSMCGFILLFSGILALLDTFSAYDNRTVSALFSCLLEVSCGCVAAAELGASAPFILGFAIGFGGLSVHCQLTSALGDAKVLTPRFWLTRLLHGCLTAILALLLLRLIPVTLPVFGTSSQPVVHAVSGHVGISVFLLMLCGIWLLSVDKANGLTYNKNRG